jgi:2-polyprenyl-3-methyl-5-hydroxy-6-metoxy-1,4-benzoquinol methylase
MPLKNLLAAPLTLTSRDHRPEIMDQSWLDREKHRGALSGLGRLNLASGVCHQICRKLIAYCRSRGLSSLRVLDIASGGGDVPWGVWKLARRRGLDLRILGLDVSDTACEYATDQCRAAAGSIVFEQCDVLCGPIPVGFDVVTCSLFLHHLTVDQATDLLRKMADAGHLLLANDLRRSATGYVLAQLACRVLTTSPVVRHDGPQSVANAYTVKEMRHLCARAGLLDATVHRAWPWRVMVVRQRDR